MVVVSTGLVVGHGGADHLGDGDIPEGHSALLGDGDGEAVAENDGGQHEGPDADQGAGGQHRQTLPRVRQVGVVADGGEGDEAVPNGRSEVGGRSVGGGLLAVVVAAGRRGEVTEEDHDRAENHDDDDDKDGQQELIRLLVDGREDGPHQFVDDSVGVQHLDDVGNAKGAVQADPPRRLHQLLHRDGVSVGGKVEDDVAEEGEEGEEVHCQVRMVGDVPPLAEEPTVLSIVFRSPEPRQHFGE